MHLTVKKTRDDIYRVSKTAKHVSPHLHNALEIVHVREGTLELGVGQELYHMEKRHKDYQHPTKFVSSFHRKLDM